MSVVGLRERLSFLLNFSFLLLVSQVNWDEHCVNVANAMHHVMKACQWEAKAVTPDHDELQVL